MPLSQIQLDILSLLKKSEHVLILPSSPIDGDSLGSSLSLYLALKKLGKKATVVAEEKIPASYNFLPEISAVSPELDFMRDFIVTVDCRESDPSKVRHEIQGNKINIFITPKRGTISKENVTFSQSHGPYDCIVTVDAADPSQFGKIYEDFTELFHLVPVINIDHHASNTGFGRINFVDVMASSTTTLVLPLIEELGKDLVDADIATLLLAGLITDTGSFQNPNTTPDAFSIAAKLIGYGGRQQEIIRNIYKTKKLSTLKLWGRTLTKLQQDGEHRMVWSVLTARDFAEIGSSPDETEGVIDELMSNAPGTEIICLIKEKGPQEVSGSIRTLSPSIDASKLAAMFGGGGHVQAAGFRIHGKTIQQAESEVVEAVKKIQKARLKLPGFEEEPATMPTPLAGTPPAPQPPLPVAPAITAPPAPMGNPSSAQPPADAKAPSVPAAARPTTSVPVRLPQPAEQTSSWQAPTLSMPPSAPAVPPAPPIFPSLITAPAAEPKPAQPVPMPSPPAPWPLQPASQNPATGPVPVRPAVAPQGAPPAAPTSFPFPPASPRPASLPSLFAPPPPPPLRPTPTTFPPPPGMTQQ